VKRAICHDLPLLLASASPRRRDLLRAIGVPVEIAPAVIDESVKEGEAWAEYVVRVVRAKLDAAILRRDVAPAHAAILVADTVVVADGAILGKPADEAESFAMVKALRGRAHEVSTRFAIARAGETSPAHEETVTTRVFVRDVDDAWARRYAATGEGNDKAGGYAIQGIFSAAVSRIEGSYSNVVGLPVCEVVTALEALGLLAGFPKREAVS
jgi:septum formation protein